MQGTMRGEARGITWPSLPSDGRGQQTHEKGTPPGSPIVTQRAATRHQAGQATQSRKARAQVSHAWLRSHTHGPTVGGRLRKAKPAKAASKRISVSGSQGAQQVSHAWLLSLTNKLVASGSYGECGRRPSTFFTTVCSRWSATNNTFCWRVAASDAFSTGRRSYAEQQL